MADELLPVGLLSNSKRLKDQGDGSVAEVVSVVVSAPLAVKGVSATRLGPVAHRTGLTAVDKLATPGAPTLANFASTSGSLVFNTAYNCAVAAATRFGPTLPSSNGTVTVTNDAVSTHEVRVTPATVTSADFYDIFFGTAATPAYLGRISAAALAAGGWTFTAANTLVQTGSAPAGSVNVRVVGAGVASNAVPFTASNAYVLSNDPTAPVVLGGGTITPFQAAAQRYGIFTEWNLSAAHLNAAPAANISVFVWDGVDWSHHTANVADRAFLTAVQTPLKQLTAIVADAASIVCLVDTITCPSGGSLDIRLEGIA